MFDVLDHLGVDSPAVRLAVWYHDAVYDTRAGDNEARSADRAVRDLTALSLPDEVIDQVRGLVLATDHRERPNLPNVAVSAFLDADLAVLGSPEDRYARYASDVRKEYDWVPEAVYREKRAEVLRHFLERPWIYRTETLRQEREAAARRNLKAEVASLTRES